MLKIGLERVRREKRKEVYEECKYKKMGNAECQLKIKGSDDEEKKNRKQ